MLPIDDLKAKARQYYNSRNYKKSITLYNECLKVMKDSFTDITGNDMFEEAKLYGNLSACYFSIQDYHHALEYANLSISKADLWYKGYYRRGEAELKLGLAEESVVSFGKSLRLLTLKSSEKNVFSSLIEGLQGKILEASLFAEEKADNLYFRALLPGRDICLGSYNPINKLIHEFAKSMRNLIYVIGDRLTGECMVVDICWDIDKVIEIVKADGMHLVGAIITHSHFDHVGGKPPDPFSKYGISVPGLLKLLTKYESDIVVYVGSDDVATLVSESAIPSARIYSTTDQEEISIGRKSLKFIHTPGHTPGSQCLLFNKNRILTGDTLFIGSCGRTDLPGGDRRKLFDSLQHKLALLNENICVFPGHAYNGFQTTIRREKKHGMLRHMTFDEFCGQQCINNHC